MRTRLWEDDACFGEHAPTADATSEGELLVRKTVLQTGNLTTE